MGVSLSSNIGAMVVANNLNDVTQDVALRMRRLSSGLRINSASDDAAGLSLSQRMSSQISASDIAKNNTQTGINLLQVMDSDLGQVTDMLQKMRDLAVQSMNGVYSDSERRALNAQSVQLINEINRIAVNSNFSGMNLLSTNSNITLQVGTDASSSNQIVVTTFASSATNLGVNGMTITTVTLATTTMNNCDTALDTIAKRRATIGANINRLQGSLDRVDARKINLESARSTIQDTDVATEAAALTKNQILQQAASAMLLQANQMPSLVLKLIS